MEKNLCEKRDGSKYKPIVLKSKNLNEMTLVTSKNHGNEILQNLIKIINFNKVEIMEALAAN